MKTNCCEDGDVELDVTGLPVRIPAPLFALLRENRPVRVWTRAGGSADMKWRRMRKQNCYNLLPISRFAAPPPSSPPFLTTLASLLIQWQRVSSQKPVINHGAEIKGECTVCILSPESVTELCLNVSYSQEAAGYLSDRVNQDSIIHHYTAAASGLLLSGQ